MKIQIEHYEKIYTLETKDDSNIYEVLQDLKQLLLCIGFDPDIVKEGFLTIKEEYDI